MNRAIPSAFVLPRSSIPALKARMVTPLIGLPNAFRAVASTMDVELLCSNRGVAVSVRQAFSRVADTASTRRGAVTRASADAVLFA